MSERRNKGRFKLNLITYDTLVFAVVAVFILMVFRGGREEWLSGWGMFYQAVLAYACIVVSRWFLQVYKQIWRYGGIQSFLRMMIADTVAGVVYYVLERMLLDMGIFVQRLFFIRILALFSVNLIVSMGMRMAYRYAYKCGNKDNKKGKALTWLLKFFSLNSVHPDITVDNRQIKIAIFGAGRVGFSLAEELAQNALSAYVPVCFIDTNPDKIGRRLAELPVLSLEQANASVLGELGIQEVVLALPQASVEKKKLLFEHFKDLGYIMKVYDHPILEKRGDGKRQLREFDIEELLFRKPVSMMDDKVVSYYRNKTVMITGGGGSIGSELCRQISKMDPKQLIIVDVYENGAYNLQQELKILYGNRLDLHVEIASVFNRMSLERVFAQYRPEIVLHAAAHKHVPLMEKNCIEAVENNVFGTLNTVELCEQYGVKRMIMVSTDKAVNPTNVMGATKRMCEMIVLSHSRKNSQTTFSATRFGNVLGSAGSVVPLFKKQIASGSPITLTDKRVIRYFMTIPEASQLVLQSGSMAKNGELFVLDMGQPVRILDLAENMIRLSGMEPYRDIPIEEVGLRPGEKLYEELLVNTEELDKTENELIFVERDAPLTLQEIEEKLTVLRKAIRTNSDAAMIDALKEVVPTFRSPEEVNVKIEA